MAAINFPNSPSVNDVFSANGLSWQWNGFAWQSIASIRDGYTGSMGFSGSQGPSGAYAAVGYTGSWGYFGSTGYTGSIGDTGYTGSWGYFGSTGYTGSWGYFGSTGYTGSIGDTGYTGSWGYFGSTGYTGSLGNTGYTGSWGYYGSTGYSGSQGAVQTTISSTSPTNPHVGDIWIDDTTGIEYLYILDNASYKWVEFSNVGIAGPAGSSGSTGYTGSLGSSGYTGSSGAYAATGYTGSVGTSGVARNTVTATTSSIANLASANVTATGYKSYVLFKIQTSCEAWVRIYTDSASRTADASRNIGTDPTPGSGVIAEILTTTGYLTQLITPGIFGFNNDSPISTNIYLAVTNYNASTQAVTVTMTMVQMEL